MGLLCYTHGMKARPAKSQKRTLHQPPPEMVDALEYHNERWDKMMEAERAKHAKERRADYKVPPSPKKDRIITR